MPPCFWRRRFPGGGKGDTPFLSQGRPLYESLRRDHPSLVLPGAKVAFPLLNSASLPGVPALFLRGPSCPPWLELSPERLHGARKSICLHDPGEKRVPPGDGTNWLIRFQATHNKQEFS
ncbi:hypothetical protein E2320_001495 [Naja naja]|nr:hypothetical protein E2320_001495 [Naja naja]